MTRWRYFITYSGIVETDADADEDEAREAAYDVVELSGMADNCDIERIPDAD